MLIYILQAAARLTLFWQIFLWVSIYFTSDSGNYRVFTVSEMCWVTIVVLLCRSLSKPAVTINTILPPTHPVYRNR